MRTNDEVGTDFRFNLKALEVATSLIFGISPGNDAPGESFSEVFMGCVAVSWIAMRNFITPLLCFKVNGNSPMQ